MIWALVGGAGVVLEVIALFRLIGCGTFLGSVGNCWRCRSGKSTPYEVGDLPSVRSAVAVFPYTGGFVSALLNNHKVYRTPPCWSMPWNIRTREKRSLYPLLAVLRKYVVIFMWWVMMMMVMYCRIFAFVVVACRSNVYHIPFTLIYIIIANDHSQFLFIGYTFFRRV